MNVWNLFCTASNKRAVEDVWKSYGRCQLHYLFKSMWETSLRDLSGIFCGCLEFFLDSLIQKSFGRCLGELWEIRITSLFKSIWRALRDVSISFRRCHLNLVQKRFSRACDLILQSTDIFFCLNWHHRLVLVFDRDIIIFKRCNELTFNFVFHQLQKKRLQISLKISFEHWKQQAWILSFTNNIHVKKVFQFQCSNTSPKYKLQN